MLSAMVEISSSQRVYMIILTQWVRIAPAGARENKVFKLLVLVLIFFFSG